MLSLFRRRKSSRSDLKLPNPDNSWPELEFNNILNSTIVKIGSGSSPLAQLQHSRRGCHRRISSIEFPRVTCSRRNVSRVVGDNLHASAFMRGFILDTLQACEWVRGDGTCQHGRLLPSEIRRRHHRLLFARRLPRGLFYRLLYYRGGRRGYH